MRKRLLWANHSACFFLGVFCRGRCTQPGLLGCLLGERGLSLFLLWDNLLPGLLKGEWMDTAGRVDGLGPTDATGAAEGRCNKRSALRSPLQCAALADAARCVGLCTALRHLPQNEVVRQGVRPTAPRCRFPVIGNRFSSFWPMQPAWPLTGLCDACRLLSLSLLL